MKAREAPMEITVVLKGGDKITVIAKSSDFVGVIKSSVFEEVVACPMPIELKFNGRLLEAWKLVSFYGNICGRSGVLKYAPRTIHPTHFWIQFRAIWAPGVLETFQIP